MKQMSAGGLKLALLSILFVGSAAEDCSSLVMLNMATCLPFLTAGSATQDPMESCCLGLKSVVETGAECLCNAFNNSTHLGVTINVTMAWTLPNACHFSNLSITNCGSSIGTSASPAPGTAVSPSAISPSSVDLIGDDGVAPASLPRQSSSSSLTKASEFLVLAVVTLFLTAL